MNNTHLRDDNLTVSQFSVLETLYHLVPLSQSELGEKILKSNGTLTTVVDSLEKKNGVYFFVIEGNVKIEGNDIKQRDGLGAIEVPLVD